MIKNKFKKYQLTILLLVGILLATLVGGVSFAWFADTAGEVMNVKTTVIGSYFERGDGSQEKPFVIARPLQLYYFSWLQNLGYFNQEFEGGNAKQYYFELSDEYYQDTGAINMEDFCLPPIGTKEQPFIGHFDGKGVIISNLVVQNKTEDLTDNPEDGGFQIIGFFGVVGAYGNLGYSYSSEANVVTNFGLDSVTIRSDAPTDNKTLIGIAAGYVNGTVSDVAVSNPTIAVKSGVNAIDKTSYLSEYYVVGFCEDSCKDKLTVTYVDVSAPKVETSTSTTSGDGTENDWGGSIAMQSIYQRLLNIYENRTNKNNDANTPFFYESVTDFYDEDGNFIDSQEIKTTYYSLQYGDYYVATFPGEIEGDNDIGRFSFLARTNSGYTYLHGHITQFINASINPNAFDGYLITDDNGNFLSVSGTTVSNATSGKDATLWHFDSEGHMYTVIGSATYYLTRNTDGALSISTTASTAWTNDKAGSIFCSVGNTNYNLIFNSGWKTATNGTDTFAYRVYHTVSGESNKYIITDGKGNYLSADGTDVANSTTPFLWTFDNEGHLFTVSGDRTYYLNFNSDQSLSLSTSTYSRTTWTNDGKGSVYCEDGGKNYCLYYSNGWQTIYEGQLGGGEPSGEYTISYEQSNWYGTTTNYLSIDNNGNIVNKTSESDATHWKFSTTGARPQGTISAMVNTKTYYLTITRSGSNYTLSTTQTGAPTFTNSNGKLGTNNGYYIRYNDGWTGTNRNGRATTLTISPIIINQTPVPLQTISAINITETVENVADDDATWFPLTVVKDNDENFDANNYRAAQNNTGYIIGGSEDNTANDPSRQGDIRVSSYPINNLSASLDDNNKLKTVYTRARNIELQGYSVTDTATLNKLQKYQDAVKSFSNLLAANDVYGLHFMNASISTDRLVNAEKVTFDYVSHYDYQMPMSSIDFTLPSNGYINFFAGTYFSQDNKRNDTFFSLHEIFRAKSALPKEAIVMAYDYKKGTPDEYIIFKCSDGSYRKYNSDAKGEYKYEKISRPSDFGTNATQKFRYVFMNPTNPLATLYYDDGTDYYTLANGTFTQVEVLPEEYIDVNEITDIKEITQVYGKIAANDAISVKSDFVYLFSDGSYSSTLPSDYELVFDLNWIKSPSPITNNAVYYYEVPANAGEYALGSVEGKLGAYLLYLDLSSNAQKVNRTEITTITQITEKDYEFPKGVQLVETIPANTDQLTVTPSDSVCLPLSPIFAGNELALSRTDGTDPNPDTVTLTLGGTTPTADGATGAGISASYVGEGIALNPPLSVTPKDSRVVKTIKTVRRIDLNVATQEETITIITTIVDSNGRTFTITDENGNTIDDPNITDDGSDITLLDTDRSLAFHTTVASASLNTSIEFTVARAETSMEVDKDTNLTLNVVVQNTSGEAANATVDAVSTDWTLKANDAESTISGKMTVQLNGTEATVGKAIELTADGTTPTA